MMETYLPPNRQLSLQNKANLTNSHLTNDNFSGWVVGQMHLSGKIVASDKAKENVEATGINDLVFYESIFLDDELNCYAEVNRMNRTSLTLHVEAWVKHSMNIEQIKAAEGTFTFKPISFQEYK